VVLVPPINLEIGFTKIQLSNLGPRELSPILFNGNGPLLGLLSRPNLSS